MKGTVLTLFIVGLASLSPESCECYRILGVFPFNGRSHFMMFEALMKGLARKGHQVDVVSTFPQKNPPPNYTDIINLPSVLPSLVNNITYQALSVNTNIIIRWISIDIGNKQCLGLGHPEMQKIIKNPPKDPPYDLVITEFLAMNCFIGLGRSLKVPTIGAISSGFYPFNHRIIANPPNLAFIPNNLLGYVASPMNFWQRFHNTVNAIFNDLYFQYLTSSQNEMMKEYFGEDSPGVREIERNVALVLTNTHHSVNDPRPVTPALIEVGGLHIQDDGLELPEDLKEWMDNSTDGFVYFTFGSMIKIESYPEEIIRVFYKSLGKIAPIRVLMKVANPEELPAGLPKNIRTFKWATQLKVLKHKNVKVFITHGGLMGTQEAIYCGIPMIGIPIFGDQIANVDLYAKKKIAVRMRYKDITETNMDEALNKILYDPLYKKRMLEISAQFRDRPMSPMDTAAWWVEYVIRQGGDDLRSPAVHLNWWEIELFDIYAFLLLIVLFLVYVTFASIRLIVKTFCLIGCSNRVIHAKKVK